MSSPIFEVEGIKVRENGMGTSGALLAPVHPVLPFFYFLSSTSNACHSQTC